jgi:hypothetical protein
MAIMFPNTTISAVGTRLNIPGSVIQFVDNTQTVSASITTAAWVNMLATSITTSKANNRILVAYLMNHRNDQPNGSWSLCYHRILVSGAASGQVMYSGHMGAAAQHIGFFEKRFIFDAPTQGTYTFTASCLAHAGTAWFGSLNSGSTNHYLRLFEIGV